MQLAPHPWSSLCMRNRIRDVQWYQEIVTKMTRSLRLWCFLAISANPSPIREFMSITKLLTETLALQEIGAYVRTRIGSMRTDIKSWNTTYILRSCSGRAVFWGRSPFVMGSHVRLVRLKLEQEIRNGTFPHLSIARWGKKPSQSSDRWYLSSVSSSGWCSRRLS